MMAGPAFRWLRAGLVSGFGLMALAGCEALPEDLLAELPEPKPNPVAEAEARPNANPLPPANVLPEARREGTYLNMGRQLLNSNQPNLAQDAFIRSLRVEGLSAAALNGAGLASERLGLLHDAKRYFQRAAKLDPNSITAQNNLGAVHYRLEEYHAAKRAFLAAFKLSSGTNGIAARNLGLVDLAILREEQNGLAEAANPVPLQRLGTGEYILGTAAGTEKDG